VVPVETAREMLAACETALPVDVAVCAAAVCDWRPVREANEKIKKSARVAPPALALEENPDILATLSGRQEQRPRLVIGFAAETADLVANARAKLARKGCDWIVGNDVSAESGTFGGSENTVSLVTADGVETWPRMSKEAVAGRLTGAIARHLERTP
jgi:phosphopantothenoylcysteine decarboxylase / phosphopantothenate---cysteine ligase